MDKLVATIMIGLAVVLLVHRCFARFARWRLAQEMGGDRFERDRLPTLISAFHPLLVRLAPRMQSLMRFVDAERAGRRIVTAGLEGIFTVEEELALRVIAAVCVAVLVLALGASPLVAILVGGISGWFLGGWPIRSRARRRQDSIGNSLPHLLDWLTLSVEAGLDFMAALMRIADKGRFGPLGEELGRVAAEVRLGVSRTDALKGFARRVELPAVTSFVSTLVQADRTGSSIGPILRAHADRLRTERFHRAERAGQAAAQKILIPLVCFIMPATFLVIFGPLVIRWMEGGLEAFFR